MDLITTSDSTTIVPFSQAVTLGLAPDGGLFIPPTITPLPSSFWDAIITMDRTELCITVAEHLFGRTIEGMSTAEMVAEAITFGAPVIPMSDSIAAVELFHGPTAAFKDFGARFLAAVTTRIAATQGRRITILVATSGDTGGAVAHSFWRRPGVNVVVLYPAGMVSPIQEKQFAGLGENVLALRVSGPFDACQSLVKKALSHSQYRESLGLTSANSINIARLLPQVFYYFLAHQEWLRLTERRSWSSASSPVPWVCAVPCGNFGNLTAGLYAQRLGVPISRFIAATNANDAVPRFLAGAPYRPQPSIATISNAMDIGDPNNMPRVMSLHGNEPQLVRASLSGVSVSDDTTIATMRDVYETTGYILDPHGAVAYHALTTELRPDEHGIFLHTAHPAKFSQVVTTAIGFEPPIPPQLAAIADQPIAPREISPEFKALEEVLSEMLERSR